VSYRQAENASLAAFFVILAVILAFWGIVAYIAIHFISKLW
jgi:hypothetical protein